MRINSVRIAVLIPCLVVALSHNSAAAETGDPECIFKNIETNRTYTGDDPVAKAYGFTSSGACEDVKCYETEACKDAGECEARTKLVFKWGFLVYECTCQYFPNLTTDAGACTQVKSEEKSGASTESTSAGRE